MVLALSAGVSAGLFVAAPANAGRPAPLQLVGENVVPGPGDLGALVEGKIGFSRTDLCFQFVVHTLSGTITRIAIHEGAAGVEGPEVVTLNPMPLGVMGLRGCVPVERELARQISRNKTQYYVLIRTTAFPQGAVRAQLGDR